MERGIWNGEIAGTGPVAEGPSDQERMETGVAFVHRGGDPLSAP